MVSISFARFSNFSSLAISSLRIRPSRSVSYCFSTDFMSSLFASSTPRPATFSNFSCCSWTRRSASARVFCNSSDFLLSDSCSESKFVWRLSKSSSLRTKRSSVCLRSRARSLISAESFDSFSLPRASASAMMPFAFSSASSIILRICNSIEPFLPNEIISRRKYPNATPITPARARRANIRFNVIRVYTDAYLIMCGKD